MEAGRRQDHRGSPGARMSALVRGVALGLVASLLVACTGSREHAEVDAAPYVGAADATLALDARSYDDRGGEQPQAPGAPADAAVPGLLADVTGSSGSPDATAADGAFDAAAATQAVQDCDRFTDRSAPDAARVIRWTHGAGGLPEACMQIALGQYVQWIGSFTTHPLEAEGGDVPNPIARHVDGVVVFTRRGTFGFVCGLHFGMKGAISVR